MSEPRYLIRLNVVAATRGGIDLKRRNIVIPVLAAVILSGLLPLTASTASAALTNSPLAAQLWEVCSYPDNSGSQYVAKIGGISTVNYNAPASDAHPQFYASVAGHVSPACDWWYIKRQKVTVTGTFPDGTQIKGDRFNSLTALFSPELSGSYKKDPATTLLISFIQNIDPTGISTILDLYDIAETNANGFTGVANEASDAYGQWSWNGFHDPFYLDRGLQFGFQLAVDSSKSGTYTLSVTYETVFETPTVCTWDGSCINDLDRSVTVSESFRYCYLTCDPPLTNVAQPTSVTAPPTEMDTSPGSYYHTAQVSVTMQNKGTNTWYPVSRPSSDVPSSCADCYTDRLALVSPADAGWSPTRVDLPAGRDVLPGQSVTFSFVLTAPQASGVYSLKWQMVREPGTGGSSSTSTFFGATTAAYQVMAATDFVPAACGGVTINTGGATASCGITVASSHSWSGTVSMSAIASGGVTIAGVSPTSLSLAAGSQGTSGVTVMSGSTTGTFTVTVTATSGSITHTTSFSVKVTQTGGGCVAYGTPILTDQGYVAVQQLRPGGTVLEYDFTTLGLLEGRLVSAHSTWSDSLVDINGGMLYLTLTDQPIYVRHGATVGWLRDPQNLSVGDRIFDAVNGGWIPVWSVEILEAHVLVYDVITSGQNNFVANGILLDMKTG